MTKKSNLSEDQVSSALRAHCSCEMETSTSPFHHTKSYSAHQRDIVELKDRWNTATGQRVRKELLCALRAGSEDWPILLVDLPQVSVPMSLDDLDDLRGIDLKGEKLDRESLRHENSNHSLCERTIGLADLS